MRSKRERRIGDLRLAIDCLPVHTKQAMLEGITSNRIIVGAYTDRRGGVCPMLAAHRCGGRTSLLAFARAWDRFTHAKRPRPATERELTVLRSHLEHSLAADEHVDMSGAITQHQIAARERRAREAAELGLDWIAPGAEPAARERELV
jgi:hypothetical protein